MILEGTIKFDPNNITNKHRRQSTWKKVVICEFENDQYDYLWRWYLKKRFNLKLNVPLRGSHITLVNDRYLSNMYWNIVKYFLDGKTVKVKITNNLRSNGSHWWLLIKRPILFWLIRRWLLLGKKYYGYHYTIGSADKNNYEHSEYIHQISKKYNL